ncbi:MAG: proline dehydrogenase [Chloroflexi bacterium]|nr:MAG: proline dehydrogenase [Chloroflexota bacterium]
MRRILLWAAHNRWLRDHVPRWRFVRRAVRRFMPGEDMADALAAADRYRAEGIRAVFTLLGENLAAFEDAEAIADHYRQLLGEIDRRRLGAEVSVKLTQLGFDLDPERTYGLVDDLASRAAAIGSWLWIDMEGSAYVERTIALYERAKAAHDNVGLCIQAYLHRTPGDLVRLMSLKPAIRLVKGAYDEPAAIAYRKGPEVDAAYLAAAADLLTAVADGRAARAILGTHDLPLIEQSARFAEAHGLDRDRIEIQMLYGIRAGEQRRLAAEGYNVRALVSYGSYWYPWYVRRLAERPANLVFALRQLLP